VTLASLPALATALSLAALGCGSGGTPSTEPSDAGSYAVCPPGLDASFDDLLTRVMATTSCGTNNPNSCHSSTGSIAAGNLLDFTAEAGTVYADLVGKPATNISGDVKLLRVAPFDAGGSMLYVKLTLTTLSDPHYGAGMPLTAPGSVCPEALDAFKTWIDTGAQR
jgi:hypothetical protein